MRHKTREKEWERWNGRQTVSRYRWPNTLDNFYNLLDDVIQWSCFENSLDYTVRINKNLISIANIIDVGYWLKCIECTCTTAHCNLCIRVFRLHLNVNRIIYLFLNKTYDAFVIIKSYDSKLPSVLRTVLHR